METRKFLFWWWKCRKILRNAENLFAIYFTGTFIVALSFQTFSLNFFVFGTDYRNLSMVYLLFLFILADWHPDLIFVYVTVCWNEHQKPARKYYRDRFKFIHIRGFLFRTWCSLGVDRLMSLETPRVREEGVCILLLCQRTYGIYGERQKLEPVSDPSCWGLFLAGFQCCCFKRVVSLLPQNTFRLCDSITSAVMPFIPPVSPPFLLTPSSFA